MFTEYDYRLSFTMAMPVNNLTSSANVFAENQYAEFTTLFRIQFKQGEVQRNRNLWKELLSAWSDVCIRAIEMRMDSCVSMLFRNRDNVIHADEYQIIFKKANGQIHAFNHFSFRTMENTKKALEQKDWEGINNVGARQILKALYWIPEDMRKDHGGFGFGQLISCLEEFTL